MYHVYLLTEIMQTITDIPLYEIIKAIEEKHGEDTHMIIEAFIDDDNIHEDLESQVPVENLLWWCEFQDQIKVFDNIIAVQHWFMNEVEFDPEKGKVMVDYN